MSDWKLVNDANGNTRECGSRSEAQEAKAEAISLGIDESDLEIVGPESASTDGGTTATVVDDTPTDKLPDDKPSVDTDPMDWVPSDFIDHIDGSPAINRKGYEVLAHHYNIGTSSTVAVGPEESGFEFCRVKATATTDDGTEYQAHGSASVSRGDDSHLLLEMADTRARKRAIAQATGVGMVAVQELQNEL